MLKLELNSSEKAILCTGDTGATYKRSDIYLEYDLIFDECYATIVGELYAGTTSIPYTLRCQINVPPPLPHLLISTFTHPKHPRTLLGPPVY